MECIGFADRRRQFGEETDGSGKAAFKRYFKEAGKKDG